MLFGVPYEISDMTRNSGMVQRQSLIYGTIVFGHRKGSGCFPKCLCTRTLYLGQRGKPTRFLESAKGSFAESRGQTPGSLVSGSRRREPWRLALESEKDSCLSGETDFVEAFTPSFDPKAQHINRGAGLVIRLQCIYNF